MTWITGMKITRLYMYFLLIYDVFVLHVKRVTVHILLWWCEAKFLWMNKRKKQTHSCLQLRWCHNTHMHTEGTHTHANNQWPAGQTSQLLNWNAEPAPKVTYPHFTHTDTQAVWYKKLWWWILPEKMQIATPQATWRVLLLSSSLRVFLLDNCTSVHKRACWNTNNL